MNWLKGQSGALKALSWWRPYVFDRIRTAPGREILESVCVEMVATISKITSDCFISI